MQLAQVGKYRVLEKLGQGAMGEVFRAHDPVLGRDVAVKILTERLSGDETARQRFHREARSAAQLNHPNIITVHEFGEEEGMAYMAMELLQGSDLRHLIEKKQIEGIEKKRSIMEQVLAGLAFAHARGVFHRDLKPGNVHVLPDGQVKIVDFGLARHAQDAAVTSVVMGTPYYMAPEQAEGERPTARSDIFSAGALFYELLTGKRPFAGPTIAAVLFAVVHRNPEPPSQIEPDLPAALDAFVMKALEKSPEARYRDGGEMLEALRGTRELTPPFGTPTLTPPSGATAAAPREEPAEAPPRELGLPLSARPDTTPEMRDAIEDLESYLADRVPPLMAVESVRTFVGAPVEGAAAEVWRWAARQDSLDPGAFPFVDILFHAIHKLSVFGHLDLLEKEPLITYLRAVGEEIADACPASEAERLRAALLHLGESDMIRTDPIDFMRHLSAPAVADATPGLRRLTLLEHRLRMARGDTPGAQAVRRRVTSQAITVAATEAKTQSELDEHLGRLRRHGISPSADRVFRSLGQELEEWALPKGLAPDTAQVGVAGEVLAMKQIVSLPEDPAEVALRYRHLVQAATEQFNEGNLGGAVQMFDLASKLAVEKKIAANFTEPVRNRGHEALDFVRLRQYLEKPERHGQLESILEFFQAGLGVKPLLDKLEGEERRDRRRVLLDLLALHGAAARTVVKTRLLDTIHGPVPDFARRNWVYLLRLIPRAIDEPIEAEIDAICRLAGPNSSPFLVKEALLYLGHVRHPRAAQGLTSLLSAWEKHTEAATEDVASEGHGTLDRLATAMARQGSSKTWLALAEHALSRRPRLGVTLPRLAELGSQDLSSSPELVETLSQEIRDALPRGVLGRLMSRKGQDVPAMIAALAGTRAPAVRSLLREVAQRCASDERGEAATRALHTAPAASAAGISGVLDAFGIPALLVRVTENRSTGLLSLMPKEGGGTPATIGFSQGRVVSARWAHRDGPDAFYQLFERPFSGTYAFDPAATLTIGSVLGELATLVHEGVRRARALRRTSAVVASDSPLESTGTAPGTVVDEPEYDLIVALWQKACAGVTPEQLEGQLTADAFRIYRPLAQWLEEGALRNSAVKGQPAAAEDKAAS